MLVVTSRDPGAPPLDYLKRSGGIFKDMLIHDFDIFRWILGDEAATVYATGSCLTDPNVASANDIDATAVAKLRAAGAKITREPGPVKFGTTIIAFVEDPDGYKIELIEAGGRRKPEN